MLTASPWDLVIVDEAHRSRRPQSASGRLVRSLRSRYLLLLTATPVENRLADLYELVNLVRPGHLGTPREFRARHAAAGRLEPAATSPACAPAPDAGHPRLDVDLGQAVPLAHTRLADRAAMRQRALAAEVDPAQRDEFTRAEAYYDAALVSIARRRQSASPERQALLDAQAEATRTERGRRLHETNEQYRPSHEIRPFRLHLVWTPARRLPVHICRGAQIHPCGLTWLLGAARRSPSCAVPTAERPSRLWLAVSGSAAKSV